MWVVQVNSKSREVAKDEIQEGEERLKEEEEKERKVSFQPAAGAARF